MLLVWKYNRQIRSERVRFDLWPSSAAGTSTWSSSSSSSADICLHGSRPEARPSASTGESSALWFLDREAGPAGQGNTGFFYPAQPAPLLALTSSSKLAQKKKKKKGREWDVEPSCVKLAVRSGHRGGRECGAGFCFSVSKQAHK